MTSVILMTGSRSWNNVQVSADALSATLIMLGVTEKQAALRHGAARGADTLLARTAEGLGIATQAVPAQWDRHTEQCPPWDRQNATCKLAGHRRNSIMIAAGANICLAFPTHAMSLQPGEDSKDTSRGTWDCATKAKDAGIPTLVVWGDHFFPFGQPGAELLQRAATQRGLQLGPSLSAPILGIWLPF